MPSGGVLTIREIGASDRASITAIADEAFSEYSPDAIETSLKMTEREGAATLVALLDDVVVGFVVLQVEGSARGHVNAIAVRETHRGVGIGGRLLERLAVVAAEMRLRRLRLVTAESNVAAVQLFLGNGYRIDRRLARYYQRGQDAVAMSRRL